MADDIIPATELAAREWPATADIHPGFSFLRTHLGDFVAGDKVVVAGRTNMGKALPLDTPVPTPHGWRELRELRVGDLVFGSDGRPCLITALSDIQALPQYTVWFDDGTQQVASEDHRWSVEVGPRLRRAVVRTCELVGLGRRVYVPLCGAVAYPEQPLPVDPYLLGLWLGDVTELCGQITTPDASAVLANYPHHVLPSRAGLTAPAYVVDGLQAALRRCGLLGNKHIPAVYQVASVEQRRALLAGLMDSDGTASGEFCTVRPALAASVAELVRGLGVRVCVRESRAMLAGRDCGPRFRLHIRPAWNPFRLPRKAVAYKPPTHTRRVRVAAVTGPAEAVAMRCLAVDSSDRTYLCGKAYRVTHNSHLALALQAAQARAGVPALYASLEDPPRRVARRLRAGYAAQGLYTTFPLKTSGALCAAFRRAAEQYGVKSFCVDYFQKVRYDGSAQVWSKPDMLDVALSELELCVRALEGVLILVSQVTRPQQGVDSSEFPKLYELKESAAIENGAEVVLILGAVKGRPAVEIAKAKDAPTGVRCSLVRDARTGVLSEPDGIPVQKADTADDDGW